MGDVVHVMSPAIGANTALRDAQVLTDHLTRVTRDGRPLLQALHAYERDMFDYAFDAVRESTARGHHLVGQDPMPTTM
ncbi:FAD-dependent oxidoreductase [Nocardia sp. NPDC004278]